MKLHGLMMLGCSGLMTICMAGCSSWSTYPSVETPMATKLSRPTYEPVPTVMAEAIKYGRGHYIHNEDLPINLPAGANWKVYEAVFERLDGGHHMTAIGEKALHITQVRTRGANAQVDMIYPREDGLHQSVTLTFQRSVVEPWHLITTREWQVRNLTPPEPNYIGPTAEELEKIQKKEEKKKAKEAKEAGEEPAPSEPASGSGTSG